nr:twin-arginine translocase subunit TatC [Rhodococcus erythropolis]
MATATATSGTMPIAGHLREARRRATRAAVSLLVGVVIGFILTDRILDILRGPVEELAQSRQASLNYDTVTGAFDLVSPAAASARQRPLGPYFRR